MKPEQGTTWKEAVAGIESLSESLSPARPGTSPALRIAIPFSHSGAWAAQISFLRSVVLSLRQVQGAGASLYILNMSGDAGAKALPADIRDLAVPIDPRDWHSKRGCNHLIDELGIDCVLNLFGPPPQVERAGLVGWIADFQHSRMPQFFPAQEIEDRDRIFGETIAASDRVLLSSEDAGRDLARFAPGSEGKARVHSFPSGFAFQNLTPAETGQGITEKYHLPKKFILTANQFWSHKNHLTVVEAAAQLGESGCDATFVLTGLPADYRDPANSLVSGVLQKIAALGVRDRVILLGQVPFADLIALLRTAALIVQPSSFEGWSTTVQDAKALGRPVACSDIAVHREQAPAAVGFFDPTSPPALAELIGRVWSDLPAGPDLAGEAQTLEKERLFAADYGTALWKTCAEAADSNIQKKC